MLTSYFGAKGKTGYGPVLPFSINYNTVKLYTRD